MTPELAHAMEGCEVVALDSAARTASCALVTADGRFLKLSGTAALLAGWLRDGKTLDEIAELCASSVAQTEETCRAFAEKLEALRRAPPRAAPAGFVARRSVLSAQRVRALAAPLAVLCGPTVMPALGAISIALMFGLVRSEPAMAATATDLWIAYLACIPILLVHELGHASACHRHGAPVGSIGLALYFVYPAFYCDVTAAWRLGRWQRLAVDLGGVYFQSIVTAGIAVGWRLTGAAWLGTITVVSCGIALANLIPFFALDGYWVLSDALGVVNLRDQRRFALGRLWRRICRRPVPASPWPAPTTAIVAVYSLAAVAFTAVVAVRLLPRAATQLVAAPSYLVELYRSACAGQLRAALAAVARLATAALVAWFAFALVRRAARGFARVVLPRKS